MSEQAVPLNRRPTTKILNNGYFTKNIGEENFGTRKIKISPYYNTAQHEEAFTEDPVLLQERKDTEQQLYKLFKESPYWDKYPIEAAQDSSKPITPKIPKAETSEVFYYFKEKLEAIRKISTMELIIAINEFFEFSYDFVAKKVLSPKLKMELYCELYDQGFKKSEMDDIASVTLF